MSKSGSLVSTTKEISEDTIKDASECTLNITNRNGSIDISGWDNDFIQYVFTKSSKYGTEELEKVQINIEKKDKTINISAKTKEKVVHVSVKMELNVPRTLLLDRIMTSNGHIALNLCAGNAQLATSNGRITATDHQGNIVARSSNGRIELSNVDGVTDIATSNGKIVLRDVAMITNAITSNGSIYAEVFKMNGNTNFVCSNGSITLMVNEDIDANVEARTSNSKIVIENLDVRVLSLSHNVFSGRTGKGGPTLSAITSNGKIRLEALSHTGEYL